LKETKIQNKEYQKKKDENFKIFACICFFSSIILSIFLLRESPLVIIQVQKYQAIIFSQHFTNGKTEQFFAIIQLLGTNE